VEGQVAQAQNACAASRLSGTRLPRLPRFMAGKKWRNKGKSAGDHGACFFFFVGMSYTIRFLFERNLGTIILLSPHSAQPTSLIAMYKQQKQQLGLDVRFIVSTNGLTMWNCIEWLTLSLCWKERTAGYVWWKTTGPCVSPHSEHKRSLICEIDALKTSEGFSLKHSWLRNKLYGDFWHEY